MPEVQSVYEELIPENVLHKKETLSKPNQVEELISDNFGFVTSNIKKGDRRFLCGVELEIEDILDYQPVQKQKLAHIEQDHSLRNNGWEFKYGPMTFDDALERFAAIHAGLKLGPEPFSDRTSIHVHVNMASLKMGEVKNLILTYALLEPLFFDFAGPGRQNNIFCVPLNYTYLPSLYKKGLVDLHNRWHKYTAFNICPLGSHRDSPGLGTIEFRHMYGTADKTLFFTWLNTLRELYYYIEGHADFDVIEELKKGTNVSTIARKVIPSLSEKYPDTTINLMCEDTAIDVKLAAGGLNK